MKKLKNNKGITLMALVITIIILIILASIGTYSGVQVVKSAQFTAFSTELKIMQTQVNKLYEEKKNGNDEYVDNLGKTISSNTSTQTQANNVFTQNASGITDQNGYKYFDTDTIKSLNIEGVEGEFFVNIDKRSVVSYDGFEYAGKTYYTLEQLPDGLYNVEHNTVVKEKPTFDKSFEKVSNNEIKVSITNITYTGNINKWKVMYRKVKENEEEPFEWNSSDTYSISAKEPGIYKIKIMNNNVESDEQEIIVKAISDNYQQLDYIKLNNTNPQNTYIATDIMLNNISSVIVKYGYEEFSGTGNPIVLSAINLNNPTDFTPWICSNGEKSNADLTISPIVEKSENLATTEFMIQYNSNSTNTLKIGGGVDNNTTPIGKYYYIKVKDKNNKLVFYGIPCYKKSDNVENIEIGMYDLIGDKFYTSTTSETAKFQKGENVEGKELEKSIIIEE